MATVNIQDSQHRDLLCSLAFEQNGSGKVLHKSTLDLNALFSEFHQISLIKVTIACFNQVKHISADLKSGLRVASHEDLP